VNQAPSKRIWIGAGLACLFWASTAGAQATHPLWSCADLVTRGLRAYVENGTARLDRCEQARREGQSIADCPADSEVASYFANLDDDFQKTVDDCYPPDKAVPDQPGRALCPIESRSLSVLLNHTTDSTPPAPNEPDQTISVRLQLTQLVRDLWVTPFPGCTRPTSRITNQHVLQCADTIAEAADVKGKEAAQCFFSCEKNNLASSDACVDDTTGDPIDDDVIACVAEKTGPNEDLQPIASDCTSADLAALGCPLGEQTVDGFLEALGARLEDFAQDLNFATFHSDCRTSLPNDPVPIVPAQVTLEPSLTKKQVNCGQVLDADFFGSDRKVSFDTDLNCVSVTTPAPGQTAINGIVVARTGVVINGRARQRTISGPGSRKLRTGAGILLAPGVKRVRVVGFKRIQNFAFGVRDSDAADNKGMQVLKSTLFRNLEAGVYSRSLRTRIVDTTLDRNGIGADLGGDDSVMNRGFVRRSEPQSKDAQTPLSPGWGALLTGTDANASGVTVRIVGTEFDGNRLGIVVQTDHHLVEQNKVQTPTDPRPDPSEPARDGIWVVGSSNRINSNSVKFNTGNGIVVDGDLNELEANRCEDNDENGYVVSGDANQLVNNDAGSMGHGNHLAGYLVDGTNTVFDTNHAEANLGQGFRIETPTAQFKAGSAKSNGGIGFEIMSDGNDLESNSAEANGGTEFVIAPNNTDGGGNKKNGSTFHFTATGGPFE